MLREPTARGFNSEQYEITDTNGYTRNIQLDMLALQISVMIIALIGTVIDIAIAITSSVYEVLHHNPHLSLRQLTASAFSAGQAILNTSIHTIFYIYMAEYLTLFIQYADEYSLSRLLNSKSFCQEFISISISGVGLLPHRAHRCGPGFFPHIQAREKKRSQKGTEISPSQRADAESAAALQSI